MNRINKNWAFLLLCSLLIVSCEKNNNENVNWDLEANKQLIKVMNENYYWYNQLPVVNPEDYANPLDLIEALRVNPPDRWSYVTTRQELDAYYNSGAYYGFGFGSAFDQNGKLWILYVFKSSPLYSKGIKRSWQITSINDVTPTPDNFSDLIGPSEAGLSKTITFLSPAGSSITYTFTKTEVVMNTVLFDSIYTINSKKIGYMVLDGFITPTINELEKCFTKFKSSNIDELIVDLRYNGGGSISVSNYLANLIGGTKANKGVYATYYHNDKNTKRNFSNYFQTLTNSLTLNRAIFITTHGTASASELLINGLKPFMPVYLIGSKTHGKPVGMYSFEYYQFDWAFVPICFSLKNANNEGDFFDGLAVNLESTDDVTKKFGDINEASLSAALTFIGVAKSKGIGTEATVKAKLITGRGLYEEIGAW